MTVIRRRRKMLVADLLCGAGGSSTGCERALNDLGLEMDLICVNHWPTAIETHRLNHPQARHFVQDIATVRPHLLVPEGYLDLLMASPTCTHHSVARGGKPTSDQQRSDPWHIITWLTELRVKRIIIENVWEFVGWGPVDHRTGRPIPARKGEYFRAWIDTLRALGFDPEWRKLNAADYGDATTRSRFILMARNDGRRVPWPTPTHTKRPNDDLALFPTVQPWKPARDIIDWDLKGRSIFTRKKPLAAKTLARIYAGARKFNWPEPYLVILRNHMAAQGLDQPLPVITANGTHIGLAEPMLLKQNFRRDALSVDEPTPTAMTQARIGLVEPFVCGNRTNNTPKLTDDPVGGITTATGGGQFLVEPLIVNMKGRSTASAASEPLPTQTAHAGHLFCAEPLFMNGRRGNEAVPVSAAPIPTLDTKGGVWLAEPMVLSQHNSGAARSAGDPLPTITTGGAGSVERPGCARPMLVTVAHGNSARESDPDTRRSHDLAQPLGAIHGSGSAWAVVEPFVLSQASGGAPRAVADPLPTIVTGGQRGSGTALIVPVTHADDSDRVRDADQPLPTVTGANRGELAFVTAQFGEREGQAPRIHDLDEPAPTGLTLGKGGLIEGAEGYDILFRMLEPHELAAAMGFTSEDQAYEFAGTKTDQIKQIGNAVSVAKMKACVTSIMADAAPRRRTVRTETPQTTGKAA